MNFTEAIEAVVGITKRPDKETEIASQINRAIAYFTIKGDFSRDLVEATLDLDPASYGQVVDLSDLERFRKVKALRPTSRRYYLTEIDPTQIFTPSGSVQPNRYYIGGTSLTVTLSQLDSTLEIAYYTYAPTLTEADPDNVHWMLDLMPWAVTEKAAAQIFRSIGDDASWRQYEASSMEFFLVGRRDFATQSSN